MTIPVAAGYRTSKVPDADTRSNNRFRIVPPTYLRVMLFNMIRSFFASTLIIVFVLKSGAQTRNSNDHLQTFIKVWGFLKYYHPAFASGRLDADSVFLSRLEVMQSTRPDAQFKKELAGMLSDLGPIGEPAPADTTKLFTRNQDFKWIRKSALLPLQVKNDLVKLEKMGYTGPEHRFMPANFHETQLPGEGTREAVTFPNVPEQLLSLARYWNAIEYLYPYKYKLSEPWDQVLRQQMPVFSQPMTATGFETGLLKLNTAIQDSHGGAVNIKNKGAIYGSYFPPFFFRWVGDSIVITDYIDTASCKRQDLRPGDVIYSIGNSTVTVKSQDWYVSASNLAKKKAILSSPLLLLPLRSKDSTVNIGISRSGQRLQKILELGKPNSRYVSTLTDIYRRETGNGTTTTNDFVLRSVNPDVALIDAANLSILYNSSSDERGADSVMMLMRNHSKAIILDMRCYATQAVFYNKLLSALGWKLQPFMSLKAHSIRHPGAFYEHDAFSGVKQEGIKEKYQGKVILLVDSRTHSQSEMITMIMQASGPAIVVGTQSSGADGDVIDLPMPGGYELSFSGRHVMYPDGTPSQMSGVKRDVKIKITTQAVAAGRDEILEAALKLAGQ